MAGAGPILRCVPKEREEIGTISGEISVSVSAWARDSGVSVFTSPEDWTLSMILLNQQDS